MDRYFKAKAWSLSLAGILPFIAPVFWFYFAGDDAALVERAHLYMVAYGAIILSFLGGIRWGVALVQGHANHLILSVLPSLLAWACLLAPMAYQLPSLTLGFILQWIWDYKATKTDILPIWFGHLRSFISLCVVSLFGLAIFASIATP